MLQTHVQIDVTDGENPICHRRLFTTPDNPEEAGPVISATHTVVTVRSMGNRATPANPRVKLTATSSLIKIDVLWLA